VALRQPNWSRLLTVLLVILASIAILYIAYSILSHFTHTILLFVMGALLAYVMSPLVNRLSDAFRFRWLGILMAYTMVATLLFALGVMLFTPFIEQSQSLVDNLHNPSSASLRHVAALQSDAELIEVVMHEQIVRLGHGASVNAPHVVSLEPNVHKLQADLQVLENKTHASPPEKKGEGPLPARSVPNPRPNISVPPSYVALVAAPVVQLVSDYDQLRTELQAPGTFYQPLLKQTYRDSSKTVAAAGHMYHTMATTPILLLRGQAWLDEHNVRVDLSNRFGQVAQQVSAQGTDLLNNAITILSETANILLDIILILIISFYLLSDGGNLIHRGLSIIPSGGREQAWFFVKSLDAVLGGYIRGQLLLSVLAGVLGGGGAEVLGVPYPLLIGIMTGLLEAVPVIGPMVAAFPAVIVALFFTPFATAVILLVWFIVFQQLVTNVLGPRVMGKAVGIHPLEAMLAVLIGYPVGGFLGAFLAVPVMGIVHILVREAYAYFVLGRAFPSVELPEPVEEPRPVTARPVVKPTGTDPV
jgi:predicted PurR-regulated permease PerM